MKRNNLSIVWIILIIIFSFNFSFSQERVISGIITTFDSIPLVNAQISVKSSKLIVKSDTFGNFQVSCLPIDKLKISANGFISQNVKLNGKIKLVMVNLMLKTNPKSRDIAIGYGHVKDKDLLYAISSVENKNDFSHYSDMFDLIKSKFPGVQVSNGEIIIRGSNSFNSSNAALIVVDGMPMGNNILESISPVEVKSIDILKDASSSIYGSRGANGVIVIQTKRGGD
ncbi:MAG: TonB-dependent receptor plug domain-containing protein [Mariniphaga sp.]|nr:TonB-dependent receptor plug domain-containing protein [Mariniphaga sp.]